MMESLDVGVVVVVVVVVVVDVDGRRRFLELVVVPFIIICRWASWWSSSFFCRFRFLCFLFLVTSFDSNTIVVVAIPGGIVAEDDDDDDDNDDDDLSVMINERSRRNYWRFPTEGKGTKGTATATGRCVVS